MGPLHLDPARPQRILLSAPQLRLAGTGIASGGWALVSGADQEGPIIVTGSKRDSSKWRVTKYGGSSNLIAFLISTHAPPVLHSSVPTYVVYTPSSCPAGLFPHAPAFSVHLQTGLVFRPAVIRVQWVRPFFGGLLQAHTRMHNRNYDKLVPIWWQGSHLLYTDFATLLCTALQGFHREAMRGYLRYTLHTI